MAGVAGWEDAESQAIHEDAKDEKRKAEMRKQHLTTFLQEIKWKWSSDKSRILGHVLKSLSVPATPSSSSRKISLSLKLNLPRSSPPTFLETSLTLERSTRTSSSCRRCISTQQTLTISPGRATVSSSSRVPSQWRNCASRKCWTSSVTPVSRS